MGKTGIKDSQQKDRIISGVSNKSLFAFLPSEMFSKTLWNHGKQECICSYCWWCTIGKIETFICRWVVDGSRVIERWVIIAVSTVDGSFIDAVLGSCSNGKITDHVHERMAPSMKYAVNRGEFKEACSNLICTCQTTWFPSKLKNWCCKALSGLWNSSIAIHQQLYDDNEVLLRSSLDYLPFTTKLDFKNS